MKPFYTLFYFGLKRRSKDFFVLFYHIIFPIIVIMLLGYLTSMSYGTFFTSYHYYTITIIPFCAIMGISTISYAAQDEKLLHTSYRYLAAPITARQIVLSKFLSCTTILSVCNIVTILTAAVVFRLNFHGHILMVLLLISETVTVTGFGLFLGLISKNLDILRNFLNIPIVIFGFLGGTFFPVNSFHPVMRTIIKFSPLTWLNRGIISYLYSNFRNSFQYSK